MKRIRCFFKAYFAGILLLAASQLVSAYARAQENVIVFLFAGDYCPATTEEVSSERGHPVKDMIPCTRNDGELSCQKGSVARLCGSIDPRASQKWLGSIFLTAAFFCPAGTIEAAGQELPLKEGSLLFSVFGNIYGGDGRSNFMFPDLRDKVPLKHMRYCIVMDGDLPSRQ